MLVAISPSTKASTTLPSSQWHVRNRPRSRCLARGSPDSRHCGAAER